MKEDKFRIPCCTLRQSLKQEFKGHISDREFGCLIRQAFPSVKRKKIGRKGPYFYLGLEEVSLANTTTTNTQQQSGVTETMQCI